MGRKRQREPCQECHHQTAMLKSPYCRECANKLMLEALMLKGKGVARVGN